MTDELKDLVSDIKEQVIYLRELGVEAIDAKLPEVKLAPSVSRNITPEVPVRSAAPLKKTPPPENIAIEAPPKTSSRSRLSSLPSLTKRAASPNPAVSEGVLHPAPAAPIRSPASGETMFESISVLPETDETMEQIWADIGNCTRCPLHEGRTQIVHSVGNYTADLMFVGEAPGAAEDAKGEPFVGRAGQLLNKIIEAIGMKREDVCIGNINRCRPPANRQPTLPEAHTCRPFLMREIAVIRPKVIVVMGNTALHNLLDTKIGITRMRGQFHDYFGVKVMPTFHPAYLLRDPSKKREVWDDMKMVKAYLTSLTN
ncbi:MAG: uracil-DNA glycosylase [Pyrinomonadaceae bacterium]